LNILTEVCSVRRACERASIVAQRCAKMKNDSELLVSLLAPVPATGPFAFPPCDYLVLFVLPETQGCSVTEEKTKQNNLF